MNLILSAIIHFVVFAAGTVVAIAVGTVANFAIIMIRTWWRRK